MSFETKYIYFHNDTDLPIMIDSWVDGSNTSKCLRIEPREKLVIHSSVGEWYLNAFLNPKDRKLWDENEQLKHVFLIGKFRSHPCSQGNYSWLEYDNLFDCIYSESNNFDDPNKGLIKFSLQNIENK